MNKKIIAVIICFVIAIAVIGVFQWRTTHWGSDEAQNAFEVAVDTNDVDTYAAEVEDQLSQTAPKSGSTPVDNTEANSVNDTATAVPVANYPARVENGFLVIGSADAPITITEFSSLSCPHCASFHKDTLPSLKKDYIDTGKVQMVFHDFPLNQQALSGTLLLKCMEPTPRHEMMELLFTQQSQWAFDGDFQDKLKQYAALVGLPNNEAEECMNNGEEEKAILQSMRQASTDYNISSTPTFLLQPGNKIISGAAPYGTFSTEIEKLIQ